MVDSAKKYQLECMYCDGSSAAEWSPQATGRKKMWYVYVLRSLVNKRLYTGSTNDLDRRLQEHNSGRSSYTKHTRPFELLYTEKYPTRLEARRRELFLKTGKGREILKEILDSRQ